MYCRARAVHKAEKRKRCKINQIGHIFLNHDIDIAKGSVQFLLTGTYTPPTEEVEEDTGE